MGQMNITQYSEAERMRLRALILISSEIIAENWPMRAFVHHNPLHSLEKLPFEKAVQIGLRVRGGKGYLSNELFRDYFRSGRILPRHIHEGLKPLSLDKQVVVGRRRITHFEVLQARLLQGLSAPAEDALISLINRRPDRLMIRALAGHLVPAFESPAVQKDQDTTRLETEAPRGLHMTLAEWCDRTLGTEITDQINREMIKWCEAFFDEGHASWPMPLREKGFYGVWRFLAKREWSTCGITGSREKLILLPEYPEDVLLEHLAILGIPSDAREAYLSFHLAALPGWGGFIKWRAEQSNYEWQQFYPADLTQYLAVRLWYERELVQKACGKKFGKDGTITTLLTQIQKFESPKRRPDTQSRSFTAAWQLTALASALGIDPSALMETAPEELKTLVEWMEAFAEPEHGAVWLKAFEAGYRETLIAKLKPNISSMPATTKERQEPVRPQAQAVFCIDVRSEPFRRHLEAIGDYETFGFAGFFSVFIRYRELGSHHDVNQFPVIMKARNWIREVPRTYQGQLLPRHHAGAKWLHAGHALLHDLKENVVTPYVAVESLGWFYALPFIGKTIFTSWYRSWSAWLRRAFVPPVATTLTVDKLSRDEVEEMLASEQRGTIRRALQKRFGDRHLNLSLERLEFLRRRALDETPESRDSPQGPAPRSSLSPDEETAFVKELRDRFRINQRSIFSRMERITQTGFTLNEQVFTVETALRMMGLTANFARLILFCGHGSTSENNPFEAALDCGACGGNAGKANARVLAIMANKPQVRDALAKNGVMIPQDTYFIAGQHDTTTDEVELFDLEDLPPTHRKDLSRFIGDLQEAGLRNNQERCARFPEMIGSLSSAKAARETRLRSRDWSQVRPEWGLSGNAAFIIGRRDLTLSLQLEGRVFLHSYDYQEDSTGRLLEIVMTGPQVVGEWINMEHYFSTTDPEAYGSGSKIYHNVVGRFGIMSGPQSDLRTGLASQTVMNGAVPYHEPMRLLTLIEAPRERISEIIQRHRLLQHLYENEWVHLMALDPYEKILYDYIPKEGWKHFRDEVSFP